MEKEENVYEEVCCTEKCEDAEVVENQKDSAVLGKFKDVDALARAYSALQAEFTRRSQRLKELEKLTDNSKESAKESGAEKLRKTANARREAAKAFDKFVAEVGTVQADEKESESEYLPSAEVSETDKDGATLQSVEETANGVEYKGKAMVSQAAEENGSKGTVTGGETAVPSVANSGKETLSSEELYAKVSCDESVRLRIIGEYLSSLTRSSAPITANNSAMLATPPARARSLGEASQMALHFLKNKNKQ